MCGCGPFGEGDGRACGLRVVDLKCITLEAANGPTVTLTSPELENLLRCGKPITKLLTGVNPVVLRAFFRCPQFVEEIEIFGSTGNPSKCALSLLPPISGDFQYYNGGDGVTKTELGSVRGEPKTKITAFDFTFLGTSSGGKISVSLGALVAAIYCIDHVYAPREQPANVRIVDRVLREDIQRVVAFRPDPMPQTVDLTDAEIDALFDGSKDTCIPQPSGFAPNGNSWLADDELLFIFKEPQQIHSAEIINTVDRTAGSLTEMMGTDVVGDWEAVSPDPAVVNLATAGVSEFAVGRKTSAISFKFTEDTPVICEAVFKTFFHEDITCECPA